MHTVASPDPHPRGGGQLPKPNECNSTLTSATRGETLTPNPNECNSTLTSGTKGIYRYLYIDEESGPCSKFVFESDLSDFLDHGDAWPF